MYLRQNYIRLYRLFKYKVNKSFNTMESKSDLICEVCFFKNKSCVCQSFWSSFERDLSDLGSYTNIDPSPLTISTMTFGIKLEGVVMDLNVLVANAKRSLFCREIKFKNGAKKSKKDDDLNFQFYNQCSITSYIPDERDNTKLIKVSTKIFHNGSLNFTGVKTIKGVVHMIRYMIMFLTGIEGVVKSSGKIKIRDVKISMINSDYKLGKKVRQMALKNLLQGYSDHVKFAEFDPSKYNGVLINFVCYPGAKDETKMTRKGITKAKGEITISVFNTGNIIVTGGNTIYETMMAYKWINKFFDENSQEILRDFPSDYKPKKKNRRVYFRTDILKEIMSENKKDLFDNHKSKMSSVLRAISSK